MRCNRESGAVRALLNLVASEIARHRLSRCVIFGFPIKRIFLPITGIKRKPSTGSMLASKILVPKWLQTFELRVH